MVDLDQCAHATINGCDKERRGWYPLPGSLSPSICLPSCPSRCPLPDCFSLHSFICICTGTFPMPRSPLMAAGPDVPSAASIRLPPSTCSLGEP
ncbi:hypothetical protein EYF80_061542 [Liparis tanakae]|uniref:Uncharacterized protein n=1 Tax=Liparis tanakae TaxID=230148 RepID=A0A4Z2EIZ7_9TELE|nr:hypothetical protein EYF80_061542 [Liparis tanakae]